MRAYVNLDRYSWSATLTVLVGPLLNRPMGLNAGRFNRKTEMLGGTTYFAREVTPLLGDYPAVEMQRRLTRRASLL
jgi:hypothetical protein